MYDFDRPLSVYNNEIICAARNLERGRIDYEKCVAEMAKAQRELSVAFIDMVKDVIYDPNEGWTTCTCRQCICKKLDEMMAPATSRIPPAQKPEPPEMTCMMEVDSVRMPESQFLARKRWLEASLWNRVKFWFGIGVPDFTRAGDK